jgi:hypothetical protein
VRVAMPIQACEQYLFRHEIWRGVSEVSHCAHVVARSASGIRDMKPPHLSMSNYNISTRGARTTPARKPTRWSMHTSAAIRVPIPYPKGDVWCVAGRLPDSQTLWKHQDFTGALGREPICPGLIGPDRIRQYGPSGGVTVARPRRHARAPGRATIHREEHTDGYPGTLVRLADRAWPLFVRARPAVLGVKALREARRGAPVVAKGPDPG